MATLKKHMPEWVGLVPYSHWVNKTWGYPTDCSPLCMGVKYK
jgi:hypothetical protein